MEIRPARSEDARGIRRVHLEAFPTSVEADLVDRLRVDGDIAMSLVAIDRGEVIGNIVFSRMSVEADGRAVHALGLAPVAVLPERQKQGFGSKLIEAALAEARSIGAEMVFVLGDPAYYRRFGFSAEEAKPFASPYAGPYFQAKQVGGDHPLPSVGRADYAAAFKDLE